MGNSLSSFGTQRQAPLRHGVAAKVRTPALWKAAADGHTAEIRHLLATEGTDIEERGGATECSPLQCAAYYGHLEALRLLLQAGACTSPRTEDGRAAFHYATQQGHADVMQLLIDHGADASVKDTSGQTPLHYATLLGDEAVVQLLLAANTEVAAKSTTGRTPLHFAAENGHTT